jgi:hypothetical protein
MAAAAVNFLSYFTVLTNLAATLTLTRHAVRGAESVRPSIAASVAVFIAIVGLVYSLVLRALWEPTGLRLAADIALHDVMPVLYLMFWLRVVPHGTLRWGEPAQWLLVPLVYCACAIARGLASTPLLVVAVDKKL